MNNAESTNKSIVFSDLGVSPYLLSSLEKLKFSTPTSIQTESIPMALAGCDLIAVAQTGSGKTLAYALSLLTLLDKNTQARALVLSPNRETAEQVYRVFLDLCQDSSLKICLASTGMPMAEQVSKLKKNPRVIIATPGRLNDHLKNNKLLLQGLSIMVIDEADRMLELGFEPQLKFIQSTLRGNRQTMMFAASFGVKSEPIAKLFLKSDALTLKSTDAEMPVAGLEQRVLFLNPAQKNNRLLDELKKMKEGVIVFTESQESCTATGRFLENKGLSVGFVHGDMNPGHRNRILREFREKKIQIMVTTDLLARGIDVPHVKYVVNYDLPYKAEDFLHRIGRTARAGREGMAITFIAPTDERTYRKIKQYLEGASHETISENFKFD